MAFIKFEGKLFNTNHIVWVGDPAESAIVPGDWRIRVMLSPGIESTVAVASNEEEAWAKYNGLVSLIYGRSG